MDEVQKKEIQELLKADINIIYKVIGSSIQQSTGHHRPGKEMDDGKSWLKENREKIRDKICLNEKIKEYILSGEWGKFALAAAIIDVFSIPVFQGVPVSQITVLIIKIGLDKLCKGYE